MDAVLEREVLAALASGSLPDVQWTNDDDGCDCIYQRIGFWTNPYIAETLEVRLCCVWAKLHEQYPGAVRTTPAFRDYNANEWVTEPAPWNGEADMPKGLWYRQLARQEGRSVADIRAEYQYRDSERPRGVTHIPFFLEIGGQLYSVDMGTWRSG